VAAEKFTMTHRQDNLQSNNEHWYIQHSHIKVALILHSQGKYTMHKNLPYFPVRSNYMTHDASGNLLQWN